VRKVATMGKKVLLVEDDRNTIAVVKMALEAHHYEVGVAEDGVAAIDQAFEFGPDVILLDLLVPKLDGCMVLEGLKKAHRTCDIPVIVISGRTGEEDIRRAKELGAEEYLIKPFTPEELLGTVARFVQ
jgi:DNA-binding response OmpR family regulator